MKSKIFKIKNNKLNGIVLDDITYKEKIIKEIFREIVPILFNDFMIIYQELPIKFNELNEILLNIYNEIKENNIEKSFNDIKDKDIINYTFSKLDENILIEEKFEKNEIENINKIEINFQQISKIKKESDLIILLKSLPNIKEKKILNFNFAEENLIKINSLNKIINNLLKNNPELKQKIILFTLKINNLKNESKISDEKEIIKEIKNENLINLNNNDIYKIKFMYNQHVVEIHSNLEDKMKDLCNRYINKSAIKIDINSIVFIYSGNEVNKELKLSELINHFDKERKEANILVIPLYNTIINNGENNQNLIQNITS